MQCLHFACTMVVYLLPAHLGLEFHFLNLPRAHKPRQLQFRSKRCVLFFENRKRN